MKEDDPKKIIFISYKNSLDEPENPLHDKISSLVITLATAATLITLTLSILLPTRYDSDNFVEKSSIKSQLQTIIKNDAPIELVRHVYNGRKIEHLSYSARQDLSKYYEESTPLSIILMDLYADYLSKGKDTDSLYYSHLMSTIQENQYNDPFDNLEDEQSHYFEDLRFKIGENYDIVQDDVQRIAVALDNKNQLVSKYLEKSNKSFKISIYALLATCFLSIIQIIQGWLTSRKFKNMFVKESDMNASEAKKEE